MPGPVARGTFATGQSGVAGNASDVMVVPFGVTTAYLDLKGLDGNNTVKTQKRSAGGTWVDQASYTTDQTDTAFFVAANDEWRVVGLTQQAIKDVKYHLTALQRSVSLVIPVGALNWKLSNTANLRAGMSSVKAGTGRMRLVLIGDSYIAGYGSTNNAMGSNARSGAWATRLAGLLTAAKTPATAASTAGDGNEQASDIPSLLAYDSRLSSNNATILQGYWSLGGGSSSLVRLTNSGDSFTFTPGETFDRVDLLFPVNTFAQGSFDVVVGGSVVQNIANNQFQGVGKATVNAPANSTAITLKQNSGSSYSLLTSCRTAATPKVEVINVGVSGVQLAQLAVAPTYSGDTQTWNTRACLPLLLDNAATNVVIINGWYNDRNGGRGQAETQANLQTLISDVKALGADCIYFNYAALDPGTIDGGSFASWSSAMIGTAQGTNDLPVFDMSKVIPDYNAGNSAGYYYDSLHLGPTGQQIFAQAVKDCFDYAMKL